VSPLVVLSTFLAAAVEWVEAFTIVLAVGLFRGWRPALAGTALAAVALAAIVVALGAAVDSFPVADAQVVVGVFLLLFGLRWLHKAILRAAGLKALHDEAEEFEATQRKLSTREHWVAVSTAFNGVLLEGVEVVLIVIALGGVGHRVGAVVGAVAALAAVLLLGVVLRAPLTRVPENLMKASVGVMLSSFGTFFAGEGIGVRWWHSDVSILLLVALYASLFVACAQLLKRSISVPVPGIVRAVVGEIWGLVVGAGSLALAAIAAVLGAALLAARLSDARGWAALVLVAGIVLALAIAVAESRRDSAS
jgi:Ca2+/H+ antiporter, TMEM165/GDT1 family